MRKLSEEVDRAARWSAKTSWVPWPFSYLVAWFIWWRLSDTAKERLANLYEQAQQISVDAPTNGSARPSPDHRTKG